jgi:putative FmdB family regulatory protein
MRKKRARREGRSTFPWAFGRSSMPVYEFTCETCHKNFEVVRPVSEVSKSVACPHCGSTEVQRSWSRVFVVTSKKT